MKAVIFWLFYLLSLAQASILYHRQHAALLESLGNPTGPEHQNYLDQGNIRVIRITKTIAVPIPVPVPYTKNIPIPVPIPRPIPIPVPHPIAVSIPRAILIPQPVAYNGNSGYEQQISETNY